MRPTSVLLVKALAASLACAAVGACGGSPARLASTGTGATTPVSEIEKIIALLNDGKAKPAKKVLSERLKKDPSNPALMVLRDSISENPRELLGPDSYRYTVRPGETMLGLAERLLGNRLKFYQLARYNGIDQPTALREGQVLEIPGQPPARPVQAERRQTQVEKPAPAARREAKAAPAPSAVARPASNPQAARQARAAGLAALNGGQPGRAVSLLTRAASLDPSSALIARDLARARRIAASVAAK